ncbi:MAG: peptidase S9, partial [Salinibacter sp.]
VEVASGETRVLPLFRQARHINPQFSPDGRHLYFVADPDGYSDVYRYALEGEQIARMTRLATGVSGITSLSPALSVASQAGRLVFSVYESDGYSIHSLDLSEVEATPVERAANPARADVSLPPVEPADRPGLVSGYLGDPSGLPDQETFDAQSYRPRLHLDYIGMQGGVGVGYTSGVDRYNTQVGGGVGFLWNDLMGDHTVYSVVQANGTVKDIGGGVSYLNRSGRLQWGASLSHTPIRSGSWQVQREPFQIGDQTVLSTRIDQILQRTFVDQVAGNVAYPLNTNQRLEGSLGYTRLSYDFEIETTRVVGNQLIERDRTSFGSPSGLNLIDLTAAFVGDYSIQGFTGPIQGRRYRLEVGSQFGDLFYQTVLGDYRQYLFFRPVTLAFRGLHFGRYGADAEDRRLTPQFLGNGTLMRGYSFFSFDPAECGTSVGACPVFDRLIGSRTAVATAEVRVPVLGVRELGLLTFPYLPTDLVAFADGGLAWSSDQAPVFEFDRDSNERIPVFSTGLGARVNVLGALILELSYAYPFQRPDKGWHFDFQISPGW